MQSPIVQEQVIESGNKNRTKEEIKEWLFAALADLLEIEKSEIKDNISFSRYGLDSLATVGLTDALEVWLACDLDATLLYEFSTVESLASHLAEENRNRL